MAKVTPEQEYTILILGVVAVIALLSILLIFISPTTRNKMGLATNTAVLPEEINVPFYAQDQVILKVGQKSILKNKGFDYEVTLLNTSNADIENAIFTLNGKEYKKQESQGLLVGDREYLTVGDISNDTVEFWLADQWYAPTCTGLTYAQTAATGEDNICCDEQLVALPICRATNTKPVEPTPIKCGGRIITCEDERLVSSLVEEVKE